MAFNGSGVFVRLYNWVNDAAANIKIRADRMDNEMNGMATGLTTCITKDGQTTITANLPMAGFKHTGVADAANLTDYASFLQLRKTTCYSSTVGGTADAITLAYSPAFVAHTTGSIVSWIASGANTTAVTIAIDAISGTKAVTKRGSTALAAGDIPSGGLMHAQYDGTRYILLNPAATTTTLGAATLLTNTFTGAQIGTVTALTSSSNSIAINLATNNNFSHTFTENTTLANPSNVVAGQSGRIFLTQHASSPKTLAFGSQYLFSGGVDPTVTATNSALDVLYYDVLSSTQISCSLLKGLA